MNVLAKLLLLATYAAAAVAITSAAQKWDGTKIIEQHRTTEPGATSSTKVATTPPPSPSASVSSAPPEDPIRQIFKFKQHGKNQASESQEAQDSDSQNSLQSFFEKQSPVTVAEVPSGDDAAGRPTWASVVQGGAKSAASYKAVETPSARSDGDSSVDSSPSEPHEAERAASVVEAPPRATSAASSSQENSKEKPCTELNSAAAPFEPQAAKEAKLDAMNTDLAALRARQLSERDRQIRERNNGRYADVPDNVCASWWQRGFCHHDKCRRYHFRMDQNRRHLAGNTKTYRNTILSECLMLQRGAANRAKIEPGHMGVWHLSSHASEPLPVSVYLQNVNKVMTVVMHAPLDGSRQQYPYRFTA
jgi:hypothetical protein